MHRQVLEKYFPDLNWIIWFVGPKTESRLLEVRPSVKSIRSLFDDEKNVNAEQTGKFLKIINTRAAGLNIALKLEDCNSSSFLPFTFFTCFIFRWTTRHQQTD